MWLPTAFDGSMWLYTATNPTVFDLGVTLPGAVSVTAIFRRLNGRIYPFRSG
jgi:hypothetical protein